MVSLRGVRLRAEPTEIQIVPGEPVTIDIEVFNTTAVVDEFEVDVVGLDPRWTRCDPPRVPLFPSTGGHTVVTVLVDSTYGLRAGRQVLGVRARSTVDPRVSSVIEVPATVVATSGAEISIHPETHRAGRAGAFVAVVRNLTNTVLSVDMRGVDPEGAVRFTFTPPSLAVAPGDEGFSVVEVAGARPFRGADVQRPFTVLGVLADPDAEPLSATGILIQKPWVPAIGEQLISVVLLAGALLGAFLIGDALTGEDAPTAGAGAEAKAGVEIKQGVIGSAAAEYERPVAGGVGALTLTFTVGSVLPSGGAVVVTLPDGFEANAGGPTSLRGAPTGLDGDIQTKVEGRVITLQRRGNGTPTAPGATVSLVLTNIKNPSVSGPPGEILVETRTLDGQTIDKGPVPPVALAPGALNLATLSLDARPAGALTTAKVSLTLANDLPPDGRVDIAFPDGFDLSGAALDAAAQGLQATDGAAVKGGTLKLTVDKGSASVTRNKDGEVLKKGTVLNLVIAGVRNAGVSGPTGVFTITTKNGSGVAIDQAEAPGIALEPARLTGVVAALENPRTGGATNLTVFFTLPAPLPPGARIEIVVPADYGLNEGGPTTVQKGAIGGVDGTASAVLIGRTFTVLRNNDGKPAPAGTAVAITLTNVRAPGSTGEALSLDLRDGQGRLIASGSSGSVAVQ